MKPHTWDQGKPQVSEASVYACRCGICKPRSHSKDTPFHSSIKIYHHIMSALAGRFSLIKWFGWLPMSCVATVRIVCLGEPP